MDEWFLGDPKLITRKILLDLSNLALEGGCSLMSFAVCKPLEPLDKPINTDVVPSN